MQEYRIKDRALLTRRRGEALADEKRARSSISYYDNPRFKHYTRADRVKAIKEWMRKNGIEEILATCTNCQLPMNGRLAQKQMENKRKVECQACIRGFRRKNGIYAEGCEPTYIPRTPKPKDPIIVTAERMQTFREVMQQIREKHQPK